MLKIRTLLCFTNLHTNVHCVFIRSVCEIKTSILSKYFHCLVAQINKLVYCNCFQTPKPYDPVKTAVPSVELSCSGKVWVCPSASALTYTDLQGATQNNMQHFSFWTTVSGSNLVLTQIYCTGTSLRLLLTWRQGCFTL